MSTASQSNDSCPTCRAYLAALHRSGRAADHARLGAGPPAARRQEHSARFAALPGTDVEHTGSPCRVQLGSPP